MLGPTKEYDISVRPRPLPNVRRSDDRMSNMQESSGKKDSSLLDKWHDSFFVKLNDLLLFCLYDFVYLLL